MRGDVSVLQRLDNEAAGLDRAAKRMRKEQLTKTGPEKQPLRVRRVTFKTHALKRRAADSEEEKAAHQLLQTLISQRTPDGKHQAFLVAAGAGGIVIAPKYATAAPWAEIMHGDGTCLSMGSVPLFETVHESTDFPLFGAPGGVAFIGARTCLRDGVRIFALCDANACALRSPSVFGLSAEQYADLQTTALRMLQLHDADVAD